MLDLGDLAILGLLRQTRANGEIVYHLTSDRVLRGAILRFVSHVAR